MILMKVGKWYELLEENPDILIVFQDSFAIIGISVVLIVVEMDTHNVTARRIQTRNVTMSVIAREQISHQELTRVFIVTRTRETGWRPCLAEA